MRSFRSLIALGVLCLAAALVVYDVAVGVAPVDAGYVAMPTISAILFGMGWSLLLIAATAKIATAVARRPLPFYSRYDWGVAAESLGMGEPVYHGIDGRLRRSNLA